MPTTHNNSNVHHAHNGKTTGREEQSQVPFVTCSVIHLSAATLYILWCLLAPTNVSASTAQQCVV